MSKKEKLFFIVGIAIIIVSTVFVLFMLEHFSIIRIFPRPDPKQEKVIQLDDLGSADIPVGKTAVVTIFCSDKLTTWDFSNEKDVQLRKKDLNSVKVAAEWVELQARRYEKDLSIIYPNSERSDLYYEAIFADVVCDSSADREKTEYWSFIESNIDDKQLKQKYDCSSIVYLLITNKYDEITDNDDNMNINAYAVCIYDEKQSYPYELCCLPSVLKKAQLSPSVIAHEILHLFGAPDLYNIDIYGTNYGIWTDFTDYCKENYPQDIMLSTYDRKTGERLPDRITQEITDITAYYIGWLDTPPDFIDEYRLVHSQHEYKNGQGINSQ